MGYFDPIGTPNPFLTTPLIVLVARNVRITGLDEVVVEDANALPRFLMRVDAHRVFPHPQNSAPPERNIPEHGQRKKAY